MGLTLWDLLPLMPFRKGMDLFFLSEVQLKLPRKLGFLDLHGVEKDNLNSKSALREIYSMKQFALDKPSIARLQWCSFYPLLIGYMTWNSPICSTDTYIYKIFILRLLTYILTAIIILNFLKNRYSWTEWSAYSFFPWSRLWSEIPSAFYEDFTIAAARILMKTNLDRKIVDELDIDLLFPRRKEKEFSHPWRIGRRYI